VHVGVNTFVLFTRVVFGIQDVVRFQVLKTANVKSVFWIVVLYSLIEVYRRFRDSCCLRRQGDEQFLARRLRIALLMETEKTLEKSVNSYQSTRHNIAIESRLQIKTC
jgi:hypothetical protein